VSQPVQLNNLLAPSAPLQELSFLERIIDKKVNGVALSCFEAFVDWFLTTFCCCCSYYEKRYQERFSAIPPAQLPELAEPAQLPEPPEPPEPAQLAQLPEIPEQARVLHFSDGTPLYDCTFAGFVKLVAVKTVPEKDPLQFILFNKTPVFFSANDTEILQFGALQNTQYVLVKDSKLFGKIEILEKKQDGSMEKVSVNQNDLFTRSSQSWKVPYFLEHTFNQEAYLTDFAIQQVRRGISKSNFYSKSSPDFFNRTI